MRLAALGPLTLTDDNDMLVDLRGQPADLIRALALSPRQACSLDQLAALLESPEAGKPSAGTIRVAVARTRKLLAAHALPPGLLETTDHGYRLNVPPGTLDAERLRLRLAVGACAELAGDEAMAAAVLFRATRAWPDPAADLPANPALRALLTALAAEHTQARKRLVHLLSRLGQHPALVPGLQVQVRVDPACEWAWVQLAKALLLSGRASEAVRAIAQATIALRQLLGTPPGPALRELLWLAQNEAQGLRAPG
ncbi:MAG TPA: BTAD domain-containing putative transcriptional regulator [Trebonia sp.]|jgi:DNA-binding SARP family transcriptional activator|nr:BTAD domain-containing putative transcriptional regulator [Trebonia sp.]